MSLFVLMCKKNHLSDGVIYIFLFFCVFLILSFWPFKIFCLQPRTVMHIISATVLTVSKTCTNKHVSLFCSKHIHQMTSFHFPFQGVMNYRKRLNMQMFLFFLQIKCYNIIRNVVKSCIFCVNWDRHLDSVLSKTWKFNLFSDPCCRKEEVGWWKCLSKASNTFLLFRG